MGVEVARSLPDGECVSPREDSLARLRRALRTLVFVRDGDRMFPENVTVMLAEIFARGLARASARGSSSPESERQNEEVRRIAVGGECLKPKDDSEPFSNGDQFASRSMNEYSRRVSDGA